MWNSIHILAPEPMFLPDSLGHLFDGNVLGLGHQEDDEDGHDDDPSREKHKKGVLEVAEHGEKSLSNHESEGHVAAHGHALSGRASLEREHLAGDQPSQWSPRPRKCRHEYADQKHHDDRPPARDAVAVVVLQFQPQYYCD